MIKASSKILDIFWRKLFYKDDLQTVNNILTICKQNAIIYEKGTNKR